VRGEVPDRRDADAPRLDGSLALPIRAGGPCHAADATEHGPEAHAPPTGGRPMLPGSTGVSPSQYGPEARATRPMLPNTGRRPMLPRPAGRRCSPARRESRPPNTGRRPMPRGRCYRTRAGGPCSPDRRGADAPRLDGSLALPIRAGGPCHAADAPEHGPEAHAPPTGGSRRPPTPRSAFCPTRVSG
jgi:hypothetical protein